MHDRLVVVSSSAMDLFPRDIMSNFAWLSGLSNPNGLGCHRCSLVSIKWKGQERKVPSPPRSNDSASMVKPQSAFPYQLTRREQLTLLSSTLCKTAEGGGPLRRA
uniref:Uncharacterized protein n=1 Tax=Trichuris muris TaxID=70415 RepID=A0A5S6QRF3_TRIMR